MERAIVNWVTQTMFYILEISKIRKTLFTDQYKWEFLDSTDGSIFLSILFRKECIQISFRTLSFPKACKD